MALVYLNSRKDWEGIVYPGDTSPGWYDLPPSLVNELGVAGIAIDLPDPPTALNVRSPMILSGLELATIQYLNDLAKKQLEAQAAASATASEPSPSPTP